MKVLYEKQQKIIREILMFSITNKVDLDIKSSVHCSNSLQC